MPKVHFDDIEASHHLLVAGKWCGTGLVHLHRLGCEPGREVDIALGEALVQHRLGDV